MSEAASFDLTNKTKKGLYHIERPKGKKERLVYVPKKVIRELRKHNWRPNQTNRWNFYHFLKKIKRELNISRGVELTPHTLRRTFATYQAESGLPLPILQKLLGHSSVRTTALYWKNIYHGDDDDNIGGGILVGKIWLEGKELPSTENFPKIPKNPKPVFIEQKPVISNQNLTGEYNSLLTPKTLKKTPGILTNKISPRTPENFLLDSPSRNSDQLKTIQPFQEQNPTKKEAILLQKIKQLKSQLQASQSKLTEALQSKGKLKEKLTEIQKENNNLKQLLHQEKTWADNYQQQLKVIVNALKQWQKINYYQQLEQQAQIIQSPKPPPNFK